MNPAEDINLDLNTFYRRQCFCNRVFEKCFPLQLLAFTCYIISHISYGITGRLSTAPKLYICSPQVKFRSVLPNLVVLLISVSNHLLENDCLSED